MDYGKRKPGIYWHIIGHNEQFWWEFLIVNSQIPACFQNSPGDKGEQILRSYIQGDKIIAYASKYGAIGWGVVHSENSYRLINKGSKDDLLEGGCLHRMDLKWEKYSKKLCNAVKSSVIKNKYDIHHPISTSVKIKNGKGENLLI